LGKEEIFDGLARHFNTRIQVMKDRWFKMQVAGLDMSMFTFSSQFNKASKIDPL